MTDTDAAVRYLAPFAFGALLTTAVNFVALQTFAGWYPDISRAYLRVCVTPAVGAVQEPLTSKLLPAVLVFLWATREGRTAHLQANRYRFAVLGGATVGLLEAGGKLVDAGAFTATVFPPVVLHAATGLLVGASVYRLAGRERTLPDVVLVVTACATAMLLHLVWNVEVAFWLAGFDPC